MFWVQPVKAIGSFLFGCAILIVFSLVTARSTWAQEKVGYILDVHGNWVLAGNFASLNRGDGVAAGALLRNTATKPSDNDRIVVADLKGDVIKRIRCKSSVCNECRDSGTCYDPIQPLPQLSPSPSVLRASFEGLMALFSSKPDRYSIHRVRGTTLEDAVVQLSADRIGLGEVLKDQKKGTYLFTLTKIPGSSSSVIGKSEHVTLDWEPNRADQIVIHGVRPGLYEAKLDAGEFSKSFWILLVGTESYGQLDGQLRRMSAQMETWGDDVPSDVKLSFRRAYLAYLAKQMEAKSDQRTQR
jgi:hypothetical protein